MSISYIGRQADIGAPTQNSYPKMSEQACTTNSPLATGATVTPSSQFLILHSARPCNITRAPKRSVAIRTIHHFVNLSIWTDIADAHARTILRLDLYDDASFVGKPTRLDTV